MIESTYSADNVTSLLSSSVDLMLNDNIIMLESDRFSDEALKLMKEKNARSVLASHDGQVVGIVTKTDVLFKVISQGKNPSKIRLRDIMTTPVLAVHPKDTVQKALSIMDKHVVRQLIVSADATVHGLVSRDDILEKIQLASISAANTALRGTPVCIINPKSIAYVKDLSAAKLVCPYCESPFDTKEGLSKHVEMNHADVEGNQPGSAILEEDAKRKFE